MYIYIGIYISVIIGKLFLDYENDHRLETYRYSCKGTTNRYTSSVEIREFLLQYTVSCDSDMRYDGSPRGILLPITILAILKIAVDLGLVFSGAFYFYKLCNFEALELPEDRKKSRKK